MKTFKMIIAILVISAAAMSTAQARDSFSVSINVGGHGYAPYSDYHAPVHYRNHGVSTVYYSSPSVVYYAPPVRYRHHVYSGSHRYKQHYRAHQYRTHQYRSHAYGRHQYRGHQNKHHYKKHARKHHRRHSNRGYNSTRHIWR
ncbi:MAG: hypothetical protein V3U89_04020 [Methylophilaceae bacterium]